MSLAAVAGLGLAARVRSCAPSLLPAGWAAALTGAATLLARFSRRFSRSYVSFRSIDWGLVGTTVESLWGCFPPAGRGRAAASR